MDHTTARVTHNSPHCGARRTYHNLTEGCNIICQYCNVSFVYQTTPQDIATERLRDAGLNAVVDDDVPSCVTVTYPQPIWEPPQQSSYNGITYGGYHIRAFSSCLNTANETIDHFVDRVVTEYNAKVGFTKGH